MTAPAPQCQPSTEPPRTPISPVATREDLIAMIHNRDALVSDLKSAHAILTARVAELEKFVEWVDCFVSNPVTAYSVYALDGLFGMTRDKIAALQTGGAKG